MTCPSHSLSSAAAARFGTAVADGVTQFQRPEDLAWDPNHPDVLYVATTVASRILRFRFTNISNPLLGGRFDVAIEGSLLGQRSFDNVAFTKHDLYVVVSDDSVPYNNLYLVSSVNDTLRTLGVHTPRYFGSATQAPMPPFNGVAEFTGQFDAEPLLGPGWLYVSPRFGFVWLVDCFSHFVATFECSILGDQAHFDIYQRFPSAIARELVGGGQVSTNRCFFCFSFESLKSVMTCVPR